MKRIYDLFNEIQLEVAELDVLVSAGAGGEDERDQLSRILDGLQVIINEEEEIAEIDWDLEMMEEAEESEGPYGGAFRDEDDLFYYKEGYHIY